MVFDFLRKFGSAKSAEPTADADTVEYNGYAIVPSPQKDSSGWRIQGTISKEIDGESRCHHFIRADTYPGREDAISMTVSKAKRIIDEQGDRMFR